MLIIIFTFMRTQGADGKGNGSVKKEVVRVQIPVTYDRFMECMRSCGLVSLY